MKRLAISFCLIASFLFGVALSALPQLHERVHPDANQSQHECVVTLIAHGKCDNTVSPPVIDPEIVLVSSEQISSIDIVSVAPLFLSGRIFEHAPPALA